MTMQDKELKTEVLVVRITPAMRIAVKHLAMQARRDESDWIRVVIEDAIQEEDAKKEAQPSM
jgi:hypothetical protein